MRFEELSPEDQKLLQTDLGEFDKLAQEEVATAQELYTVGFEKLASETADFLDEMYAMNKKAEEEEKEEEEKDEEHEKKASEYASFIERGYFDGLMEKGAERHDDPMFYLYPFLEEKIAAKASEGAISKLWKGIKGYHSRAGKQVAEGAQEFKDAWRKKSFQEEAGSAGKTRRAAGKGMPEDGYSYLRALKNMLAGSGKLVAPYAAAGGAGYAGKKVYDEKKKNKG